MKPFLVLQFVVFLGIEDSVQDIMLRVYGGKILWE